MGVDTSSVEAAEASGEESSLFSFCILITAFRTSRSSPISPNCERELACLLASRPEWMERSSEHSGICSGSLGGLPSGLTARLGCSGVSSRETFMRDGLGSFMSRFEGWGRKRETGESLDSVKAVSVEGAYSEVLACSSILIIAFSVLGINLDAIPERGTREVAVATTRVLTGFPTCTDDLGNCRFQHM